MFFFSGFSARCCFWMFLGAITWSKEKWLSMIQEKHGEASPFKITTGFEATKTEGCRSYAPLSDTSGPSWHLLSMNPPMESSPSRSSWLKSVHELWLKISQDQVPTSLLLSWLEAGEPRYLSSASKLFTPAEGNEKTAFWLAAQGCATIPNRIIRYRKCRRSSKPGAKEAKAQAHQEELLPEKNESLIRSFAQKPPLDINLGWSWQMTSWSLSHQKQRQRADLAIGGMTPGKTTSRSSVAEWASGRLFLFFLISWYEDWWYSYSFKWFWSHPTGRGGQHQLLSLIDDAVLKWASMQSFAAQRCLEFKQQRENVQGFCSKETRNATNHGYVNRSGVDLWIVIPMFRKPDSNEFVKPKMWRTPQHLQTYLVSHIHQLATKNCYDLANLWKGHHYMHQALYPSTGIVRSVSPFAPGILQIYKSFNSP